MISLLGEGEFGKTGPLFSTIPTLHSPKIAATVPLRILGILKCLIMGKLSLRSHDGGCRLRQCDGLQESERDHSLGYLGLMGWEFQ